MAADDIKTGERLHGLDALRGAALLLGLVLHGAMAFFPTPIWVVADDQRSVWASGLFFAIHLFRMATFFLIAGLFAHMMLARRGLVRFGINRLARIAGPLAVFWGPSLTAIVAVLIWNAGLQGLTAADAPPPPTYDWTNLPLTHGSRDGVAGSAGRRRRPGRAPGPGPVAASELGRLLRRADARRGPDPQHPGPGRVRTGLRPGRPAGPAPRPARAYRGAVAASSRPRPGGRRDGPGSGGRSQSQVGAYHRSGDQGGDGGRLRGRRLRLQPGGGRLGRSVLLGPQRGAALFRRCGLLDLYRPSAAGDGRSGAGAGLEPVLAGQTGLDRRRGAGGVDRRLCAAAPPRPHGPLAERPQRNHR